MTVLHAQPRDERVVAMADMLKGACRGYPHGDVLSALLTAFRDVAVKHPCCTDSSMQMVPGRGCSSGRQQCCCVPSASFDAGALMRAASLVIPDDALLRVLQQHIGSKCGIHVRELVQQATGMVCTTAAHERNARTAITRLRLAGHRICGQPDTGYFMAATPQDLERTCDYLRRRALHSLAIEARMRQVSMPELLGQLALIPDPESISATSES